MISHCVNQFEIENISSEIMEGFKLVSKVINQSGLAERCKNLDKRREKLYWTLPEEMMARAFEVYLKEKLKERGIQNDYLVNYRSEESWLAINFFYFTKCLVVITCNRLIEQRFLKAKCRFCFSEQFQFVEFFV